MKKISFLIAILIALSYSGISQTRFTHTAGNVKDSIKDTGLDTLSYSLSRSYQLVSIQPVITKATGTMAGKSYLWSSVDGSNWKLNDSLTLSDLTTNSVIWTKASAARFWIVITGGATTVTATVKAWISAVSN